MSDPIVAFYSGQSTDHKSRDLGTILAFSDEQLETVHDWIQWLFPLEELSSANPSAPLVGNQTKSAFRTRRTLKITMCKACARLLNFYGLRCDGIDGTCQSIAREPQLSEKLQRWLTPENHNHLRLTRILKSLRLLDFEECSANLYSCLQTLARKSPGQVTEATLAHWHRSQLAR